MALTKVHNRMIDGAVVNAQDYGATGDGVTDDTTAIQAAIDAVYDAGGGEVRFPYATYITTKPLIVPKGVSLVGRNFNRTLNASDLLPRISMNTTTQSTVTEDRASYTQESEDGSDGVDQTPNTIIHLTNTKTTCGEYSGVITGLELEGNSTVAYGIIGRSANYARIVDNEINNVTNGIIILNTSYQANYENNAVRNSTRGFYINRGTSQVYTGNYASIYSSYGHKLRDIDYSLYASNAADSGAVGETGSYAYAYKFIDIQNCSIQNNGAEGLNGIFMYIDSCQASEFSNNQCISYNLTYTGGDGIAIITLNKPLCIVKNNKVTYSSDVTLTPAANRFNIQVANRRTEGNFEVKNNIFAENDGFQTGVPYLFPEAFIRNSSVTRPYGLGMATVAQNKTIYVRTTGNDNNDGVTAGNALLTIDEAVERIGGLGDIFANITVDIGAGTFDPDITLQYLVGRGSVTFQGAGIASTKLTGSIRVLSCEPRVLFTDIEFEPNTTTTWGVRCSTSNVHMYDCAFDGSAASGNRGFLRVDEGGFGSATSITINSNGTRSCFAENGGHAVLDATLFTAISASYAYADTGGRITKGGIEP